MENVIIIAVVAVVAVPIVRSVINGARNSSCCAAAGGQWEGGSCVGPHGDIDDYMDFCTDDLDD